ncbi:hypothetical protein B9J78_03085 [bacterium Unc6]|nr:hypothetical protein [bacterium Unc6]
MKKAAIIFGLYFFVLSFLRCYGQQIASELPTDIRVAVVIDANQISVQVPSAYRLELPYTGELLRSGPSLHKTMVYPETVGVRIGSFNPMVFGVKIIAPPEKGLYVNENKIRGTLNIIRNKNIKLTAINTLSLEDYIRSVVPSEIPKDWPAEAIKAQAIASRTFAMYKMYVNRDKDFDVRSDIFSQVYKGKSVEYESTSVAIKETQGLVLVSESTIFPSFFHALCAGKTENVMQIWGKKFIKTLEGTECAFCRQAPRFFWEASFTPSQITSSLNKAGIRCSLINGIDISEHTPSGRVKELILKSKGKEILVEATKFRIAVGPDVLRSTNFSVQKKDSRYIFKGQGWGHGVGLCQWGAYFMAKQGYNAKQILQFYYPSSQVVHFSKAMLP